jgi:hypothetical protein
MRSEAMEVRRSEAAAMYARACVAWYGTKAAHIARDSIRRAETRGDASGAEMWKEIAALISGLNAKHHRRAVADGKLY